MFNKIIQNTALFAVIHEANALRIETVWGDLKSEPGFQDDPNGERGPNGTFVSAQTDADWLGRNFAPEFQDDINGIRAPNGDGYLSAQTDVSDVVALAETDNETSNIPVLDTIEFVDDIIDENAEASVSEEVDPTCWIKSADRVIKGPPTKCPDNTDQGLLACYEPLSDQSDYECLEATCY